MFSLPQQKYVVRDSHAWKSQMHVGKKIILDKQERWERPEGQRKYDFTILFVDSNLGTL